MACLLDLPVARRPSHRFGEAIRVAEVPDGFGTLSGARDADYSPHYGDAKIWMPGWDPDEQYCSSNFTFVSNVWGVRVQATAGHCTLALGDDFVSSWNSYGEVTYRDNNPDLAGLYLASQTYTNVIWTTPCCPSTRNVIGDVTPPIGDSICVGGATTLAQCGIAVANYTGSYCDNGYCASQLLTTCSPVVHGLPGDSGGVAYQRSGSSNALAVGMILWGQWANVPWCGTATMIRPIPAIENQLNATLLTSP